jgi:hypothetical protein
VSETPEGIREFRICEECFHGMPLSGHKNACLHYSIKLDFIPRQQEGVKIYAETHEDQRQNHGEFNGRAKRQCWTHVLDYWKRPSVSVP